MRAHVESTRRPEVVGGLGGFGGAIAIPAGYREPLLVASTDGVGTKTAIARALGRYDTIGVDLVAMCADDVVCCGAEPLAFLDYIAVGHVVPEWVAELVGSVATGCLDAGCALIGGETAEHPGLMDDDAFDLSGCCLGRGRTWRRHRRDGRRSAVTRSSAWPRPGCMPTASRWCGPSSRNGTSTSRSRIKSGSAGRSATPRRTMAIVAAADEEMATLGDVLLTPTRIYARAVLAAAASGPGRRLRTSTAWPTSPAAGCRGTCRGPCRTALAARLDPSRWPMPSVMRLFGALGGLDDEEMRATFNGGLGMVAVLPGASPPAAIAAIESFGIAAAVVGEVVDAAADRRAALRRGDPRGRRVTGRGDRRGAPAGSRSGSRAPARTCARWPRPPTAGELGGEIVLVFADRACPALDWAAEQGIETALVPRRRRRDAGVRRSIATGAGCRRPGRLHADRGTGRARRPSRTDPQHPSIAPAGVSRRACGRATRSPTGVTVTGGTVHLVDETLDGGPIVAQEAVAILPGDDVADAARPDPGGRAPTPAAGGRHGARRRVSVEPTDGACGPTSSGPMRTCRSRAAALLSVSDKTGLAVVRGAAWCATASSWSRPAGTARALREAGLPVTDVAAVTGFPEMLDGRVKTLHPRIHGGILADRRLAEHRRQLARRRRSRRSSSWWSTCTRSRRPPSGRGSRFDELVEEIDIGGPAMVRAAAKNHASVAIVTSPARYEAVLAALDARRRIGRRAACGAGGRGVPAHRRLRRADRRGAARPDGGGRRRPARRARPARRQPTRIPRP